MGQDPLYALKHGLSRPAAYPHPADPIRFIETHISLIVLAGDYAYKFKKPVDLGFVDYSTLERRHHFCLEEVRLNRRFADGLYLGVVALTGSPDDPRIDGAGTPFEYAVQMRKFAPDQQWDRRLEAGTLTASDTTELADLMARFHQQAEVVPPEQGLGGAEQVAESVRNNFAQTRDMVPSLISKEAITHLSRWSEATLSRLAGQLDQRLADGFVRECHGDAHLANITTIDGRVTPFDCIEFSRSLRCIDVISEMAFPQMDLDAHGHADLGWHLLNRYLEQTGDYAGLTLLPLYLSYRAYVRAKVAAMSPDATARRAHIERLVALSVSYTQNTPPTLLVMVGVTGSGKSTVAAHLADQVGAIRVRSDVERKRLAGLPAERRPTGVGDGPYSRQWTQATYNRLHGIARIALSAGFHVILDATYLDREQRDQARELATTLSTGYLQVHCQADPQVLRARVEQRDGDAADDPSDSTPQVLEQHLQFPPPDAAEQGWTVTVATDRQTLSQIQTSVERSMSETGR